MPSVGGAGPENFPVVASIVGGAALGLSGTLSVPISASGDSWPVATCADAARGMTALVMRADSSDVGPDFSEFTSNAVTE